MQNWEKKNKRENSDTYSGIQHETEMSVSKRRKSGKGEKDSLTSQTCQTFLT